MSADIYPENPSGPGPVLVRPARMMAGIAADEGAHGEAQAMRIAGAGYQGHLLQHFAGLGIIFGQALHAFGIALAVVGGGQPDETLIIERHVVTAYRAGRVGADADGVIDGP